MDRAFLLEYIADVQDTIINPMKKEEEYICAQFGETLCSPDHLVDVICIRTEFESRPAKDTITL